jgi:hypothetical protein
MKPCFAAAMFVMALFAISVSAKDKAPPAVNANTQDTFATVSVWVRKQMDNGGRYSYVTPAEREKVNKQLDEMGSLFKGHADVAQMTDAQKLEMFNSQQEVNAILARRDNDRLVCTYEAPIGSHIPVKTCSTAGEIEARRRNDTNFLQQRRAQNTQGGN